MMVSAKEPGLRPVAARAQALLMGLCVEEQAGAPSPRQATCKQSPHLPSRTRHRGAGSGELRTGISGSFHRWSDVPQAGHKVTAFTRRAPGPQAGTPPLAYTVMETKPRVSRVKQAPQQISISHLSLLHLFPLPSI